MISQGRKTPEFEKWNIAAVRLLQGVVYHDDKGVWPLVLTWQDKLSDYFAPLGLRLVLDETDGFAFLKMLDDDEHDEDFEQLPRLFRRTRLSWDATLLCVLLREELLRFETEDIQNARCVIELPWLFEKWKAFFPHESDDVRLQRGLTVALRTLEDMRFVQRLVEKNARKSGLAGQLEIRRILKARLTVTDLENIRQQLLDSVQQRQSNSSAQDALSG